MADMTWKEMLDTVAAIETNAYECFAKMYKDECDRLAAAMANKPLAEYNEACENAATRIARNMFAMTFG